MEMAFSQAHDIFPMEYFWKLLIPYCSQHNWWSFETLKYIKKVKEKMFGGIF